MNPVNNRTHFIAIGNSKRYAWFGSLQAAIAAAHKRLTNGAKIVSVCVPTADGYRVVREYAKICGSINETGE